MGKRVYLLLLVFLSLGLTSCSRSGRTMFVIGISQCSDDLWRETMNAEMSREASFYQDMELVIKTVRDDTGQQIRDIESLIDAGVDLLIISPNESQAITPIVSRAYNQGIPVILVDRRIDSEDYTAYVGADNYQIGREAGSYIAGLLNMSGNVVEIRGWNGSTSDMERHEGFTDALKDLPGVNIIASRRGNYLPDEARRQMSEVLKEVDERMDVVFAFNDPMAVGVYEALLDYSGRQPYIVGIDALPGEGGGISNIEKGILDASFLYPTGGDKVMELARNILTGKSFKRENTLYTAVVDKSNVRVIQLQTEQLVEHQSKLDRMNRALDQSLLRYSNQQTLFYGTIAALILISVSLAVSFAAYRGKSRANRELAQSNIEIRAQARILAEQKDQLVSLSRELEEATQAKLVFFTNVSHELKTPLTLILGPVESLMEAGNLNEQQRDMLKIVSRNTGRLHRLITELIEFRSYENDKMKVEFSEGDLGEVLEELNLSFREILRRKNVRLDVWAGSGSLRMWFDRDKVEKIYNNLLSNAVKHTEKNGRIEVNLGRVEKNGMEYASVRVFNTGIPIPSEHIGHIFERFYKVNINDPGTGIGLALTKALVDIQGGFIEAEGVENEGTAFTVMLPFRQTIPDGEKSAVKPFDKENSPVADHPRIDDSIVVETDGDPGAGNDERPSILVIDDNEDIRIYIRSILQSTYRVYESGDGRSGVEKAVELTPDIIISDIMMPGMDGFEVCANLKGKLSTSHIPVILLTACSLDEQRIAGYESGADAYIQKPFNAEMLKVRIRKLIENRRKLKQSYVNFLMNDTDNVKVTDPGQAFLKDFQAYVETSISEPELNVDDIAREMNLSRSQLYRKVKSLTNYSPVEVVRIIRLRYAKSLLQAGSMTVSEVAYTSGFSSPSYFTKCFKEFYRKNPTDYRRGKDSINNQ